MSESPPGRERPKKWMLRNGLHILLTYQCNRRCGHCFLHCSPEARGTFTPAQLAELFDQIQPLDAVKRVYFEGGEPFLFYDLLLDGMRMAASRGLENGIVTNAFWAKSLDAARRFLEPIRTIGIADLSISDDGFHDSVAPDSPPKLAFAAACELGIPCDRIVVDPSGGWPIMFRGRAAGQPAQQVPQHPAATLNSCSYENLACPSRVHIDCWGNVQVCQGINLGNAWQKPLGALVADYDPVRHPIVGPLLAGGPAFLAREHSIDVIGGFADACHLCYTVRKTLIPRFPGLLTPPQAYGMPELLRASQS